MEEFDPLADGYRYTSASELAKDADCLAVLVEHQVIREELARKEMNIKKVMRNPVILRFYAESDEP